MKRIISVFTLCLTIFMVSYAKDDTATINMQHKGTGDHSVIYPPADQPAVYYDSNNQILIIDGLGEVSYYDVEITPLVSSIPVISTQVDGNYDTIDVSALWSGGFVISIESPTGNIFEGTFYID